MQREGVQKHVWSLGERLQGSLREVASRHPTLQLKIGGMPCAPSLGFAEPAAKVLMIRHMLQHGYLMSSQLYVTWPHTDELIAEMLAALDETLEIVDQAQASGKFPSEDGAPGIENGFARLV
jgi:hypothetical protein